MGDNRWLKNSFVYLIILVAALALFFNYFNGQVNPSEEKGIYQVLRDAKDGKVKEIEAQSGSSDIVVTYNENPKQKIRSRLESNDSITMLLVQAGVDLKNVDVKVAPSPAWGGLLNIFTILLPVLLMIGFFIFFMRQAQGSNNQALSFGKSRARMFSGDKPTITFADVAGQEEAKQDLTEVVEFLKFPDKFAALGARIPRGVLMVGPPGTGKCIVGDSIIATNKGLMDIQDIPKYYWVDPATHEVAGAWLPTVDPVTVSKMQRLASHWYNLGKQRTIRVTIRQGMTLEGTPEHPIVVMNETGALEFRRLDQLQAGDSVAISYNTHSFGSLWEIDSEQAYLMGLLTGDGNLSISNRVGLTSVDAETVSFFHDHMHERYGDDLHIGLATDGITQVVSSWSVKRDLFKAGMAALLSFDKSIPASILQAPQEIGVAFLQGLFDTDGSFERYAVSYATVSKKMADQVTAMLLNLGIVPRLYVKNEVSATHPHRVYAITISGTQLPVFARTIGFRLSRKQQQLQSYLASAHVGTNTNNDLFYHIADRVVNCWEELRKAGKSNSRLANLVDKIRDRKRVSRNSLREIVDVLRTYGCSVGESAYLTKLLEADLFFSPVETIDEGFADVYDFTVPETHSFISNGFISHNTLLSRAVAGEAGVPFFSISGSEFVEMFVGVGASRVRDLFDQAKRNAPCIVFIDEIDAVGRQRGAGLGGSHDEREQTLNQILVEMDGFDTNTNVIVVAATNRPDVLDPALVRPGRFDRQVVLDAPDVKGRIEVLKVHTKGKPLGDDINLEIIAKQTPGFSGADLANAINEAAILAARRSKKKIGMSELQDAIERVALGGPERRSRVMTEREKMIVSYHEAGHAVVGAGMPAADAVQKVTIIPRGRAGGYTLFLPEEDRLRYTSVAQFEANLSVSLGGRMAEELVLGPGEITTGASGDIVNVTRVARSMITRYGMSPKLGPIAFGEKEELIFLGREISEQRNYGDEVARTIDQEVHRLVEEAHERARVILTNNRAVLNDMASALIEHESLDGDQLRELLRRVVQIQTPHGGSGGNGTQAANSVPTMGVTTPLQA